MSNAVQLDRREPDAAASALIVDGWRVARVDGGATKRAFLEAVGEALDFPDYYGANLDALWDCLTDPGIVADPTALVWGGWETLALAEPDDWAAILQVLIDRAEREPAFTVVLAGAGGGADRDGAADDPSR